MNQTDNTKIEPELASHLKKMAKAEPHTRLPLIVTLQDGADPQLLTEKGFEVGQVLDLVSGLSGTATAKQALEIGGLPQVQSIEYDGEMHALH